MSPRTLLPFVAKWLNPFLVLLLSTGLLLLGQPAQVGRASTVITVNSTLDRIANDGQCTLREAIIAANKDAPSGSKANECPAGSGADTILLPANLGPYVLTRKDKGDENASQTGDLDITGDLAIEAGGPGVTITANSAFTDRIFHVLSGNVTLSGITISGGNARDDGGGVYNLATLEILDTTLTGNHSRYEGGGISNDAAGSLTLRNVTLSGNTANTDGGGLANSGTSTLNNVTLTANAADFDADGSGDGGGVAGLAGALTVKNSLIAGNADDSPAVISADCSGSLVSEGYNLIQDVTGCDISGDLTGNITGESADLGALQDNGGFTFTHAPLDGSPAIDAGNPAFPGSGGEACELTDQRGTYRPHGSACDIGAVEADKTNAAVLIRATVAGADTTVVGRLFGAPGETFTLQFFTNTDPTAVCSTLSGGTAVGDPQPVTTDSEGNVIFQLSVGAAIPNGQFITALATDPGGFTSDYSPCVRVGFGNDSWPNAYRLTLPGDPGESASIDDYVDVQGQSRWYKFSVVPNSQLIVTLTNLPTNYDLTLYKDIAAAFSTISTSADLLQLGAEFAPDAFTPDAFTSDVFSPDAFTPDAFTPDAFTPDAFTPDAFTPDAFTPDAFTPDAFTPDAFTPDAFTPDAYTPDAFTPDAFTPDAFTPDAFTPDAYSSAQTRSLIGISAFDGLVSEGILVNTWDNSGDYYVRVRGRNGAFDPDLPFHLAVQQIAGICDSVSADILPPSDLMAEGNNYKTVILTDLGRMEGTDDEKSQLTSTLATFAARAEVGGVLVDVSQDARVSAAYAQSDAYPNCPYAANLVAGAIKGLVDKYWEANPTLEYVVIIGDDNAIPYFRHPDHAMLASEKNYVPPVLNNTTSQASLKLGYVLSQDDYGAQLAVSLKDDRFPIPALAVGRLVETASEATGMLEAYLSTPAGVLPAPQTTLVTGYDFLADAALQVQDELVAGIGNGGTADLLLTPRDLSPTDPAAWTADDLRAQLLDKRHDLIFLAGHFSSGTALAADYTTRVFASEVASAPLDMTNAVVFSAGCHSGYNTVDDHDVPGVTLEPDWAQAFARKGVTLIAGTGYQYGDTDFIKYSEQLYLEFSEQLRVGQGAVPIGVALKEAKRAYLAGVPYLRGIDEKALLEATLFGLPMLSVDMPGERLNPTPEPSLVSETSSYTTNPGAALDLQFADITATLGLTLNTVVLTDVNDTSAITTATYLSGPDGFVVKPNEPVLPLDNLNVSVPDTVLRGAGFREGRYVDLPGILPLTGASTTEIRGVHTPFLTSIFYPVKLWHLNYYDALSDSQDGITQLGLYPAQYRSDTPSSTTGTLRQFQEMGFRLFYSDNTATYTDTLGVTSTPALSAPPTIAVVASTIDAGEVNFHIRVVGNPAAGIQEVWVTYTATSGSLAGRWTSLDLAQSPYDSTLWVGTLPPIDVSPEEVRYIVQAVNGVGLVSMDTNQGEYYVPGVVAGPTQPSLITFVPTPPSDQVPTSGQYGTQVTFSASLTSNGLPLEGQVVAFVQGPQSRIGITGSNGIATVTLSIFSLAGDSNVRASFAGAGDYQAAYATSPFTVLLQDTQISLDPQPAVGYPQDTQILTATLTAGTNLRLGDETLFFVVSGEGSSYTEAVITDYAGRARLGSLPLSPGSYTVEVYFSGYIPEIDLSLTDDRYEPAFTSTALTLLGHAPVAVDDAYQVDEGQVLTVPAPGVLGNDSDVDGDALSALLTGSPAHGSLTLNGDGSFVYTPDPDFNGSDAFTYVASDGSLSSNQATVSITVNPVNEPPDCSGARLSIVSLWPPNGSFVPVSILGITDPDGDPVTVTIYAVFQDEPVGSSPDAVLYGSSVTLRAERDGSGDGRVYHIFFNASDSQGAVCSGEMLVGVVPHDQGGDLQAIDGGALYDSTLPQNLFALLPLPVWKT